MFRLAHLSDIHLGQLPGLRRRDLVSKRITGYINWRRSRGKAMGATALDCVLADIAAAAPDHVAVTGDLMNLSLDEEFRQGRQWLDRVGPPRDVTFVPGNHDAYVIGALDKTVRAFKPFMTADAPFEAERRFPFVRQRGGVAIIGVNSARATPAFMAAGHVSEGQAEALERALALAGAKGLARIILIHHPPVRGAAAPSKRLFGIGRFQAVVARAGAELVLHGHTHLPTLYRIAGADGRPVPVVGVPAAGQMPGGRRPAAGWNDIAIDGAGAAARITLSRRRLSADGRAMETAEIVEL